MNWEELKINQNKSSINIFNMELVGVYLHELYYLCESILRETTEIFKEENIPSEGYVIQVSPVLHSRINSVLLYSSNIKKLITTNEQKGKKESRKKYDIRQQRKELFDELLEGIKIKEISKSKVRNTIEHFDQYLDDLNLKLDEPKSKLKNKYPAAAYNMTFSEWKVMQPDVYPIRLYISKQRTFYNFDWFINIGEIASETRNIQDRLNTLDMFKGKESGGLLAKWHHENKVRYF